MRFYDVDNDLLKAMTDAGNEARVKIEFELGGRYEAVFERDIVSAYFVGMREAAGGWRRFGEGGDCP